MSTVMIYGENQNTPMETGELLGMDTETITIKRKAGLSGELGDKVTVFKRVITKVVYKE